MGVAFVRRELVEVAEIDEIDRFNGRRRKAENVEPASEMLKSLSQSEMAIG